MARNTTIIRSNYLWDESAAIYEHALKLWETLPQELDYDILFSQRGVMNLAHNLHDVREGHAAGQRQPPQRHRRRMADARRRQAPLPDRQHLARRPLPRPGRHLPAARRDRQARPRRLGLRARRRRAGRRPHPERRGDRDRASTATASRASRRHAARSRAGKVAHRRGRPRRRSSRRWPASGCRSSRIRCRRWSRSCSSRSTRPSSCRTPSTSTSSRRTRASWSWAPGSTPTTATASAARST